MSHYVATIGEKLVRQVYTEVETLSRSKKGSVSIGADKGFLRLYWRYQGQRYFLPIGLADTAINRSLATRKATMKIIL